MTSRRVLAHCNAGREFGLGHLMRVLAVAEEAVARGWQVRVLGELDDTAVATATRLLPDLLVERVRLDDVPAALAAHCRSWQPDVLHLDTYWLDPGDVPAGPLLSNVQDAPFGVRAADLVIDPNLGAETRLGYPPPGRFHLLGLAAAALRRQVRERAIDRTVGSPGRGVLVVLGGTDPHGLTTRVVEGLARLADPPHLTVVTPEDQRGRLEDIAARIPAVRPVGFLTDLPAAAVQHSLVVSAAGTSVWDQAPLGVPAAILAVTQNQRAGYLAATRAGMAWGLGLPPHDDLDASLAGLVGLLEDPAALAALASRGRRLVDGLGTWRIVTAWEHVLMVGPGRTRSGGNPDLLVRPAEHDDARLLLEWRNDPATRTASRSHDEIDWSTHVEWVERVLADPDRQLLVVLQDDRPVATVRWDRGDGEWEVSITVAPHARGQGLATAVLLAAEASLDAPDAALLTAAVHRDNAASLHAFARCGYLPYQPPDAEGFMRLAKWRICGGRRTPPG